MNNKLRKIYTNCRLYGKIIFCIFFYTKTAFLIFIVVLYNGVTYDFKY